MSAIDHREDPLYRALDSVGRRRGRLDAALLEDRRAKAIRESVAVVREAGPESDEQTRAAVAAELLIRFVDELPSPWNQIGQAVFGIGDVYGDLSVSERISALWQEYRRTEHDYEVARPLILARLAGRFAGEDPGYVESTGPSVFTDEDRTELRALEDACTHLQAILAVAFDHTLVTNGKKPFSQIPHEAIATPPLYGVLRSQYFHVVAVADWLFSPDVAAQRRLSVPATRAGLTRHIERACLELREAGPLTEEDRRGLHQVRFANHDLSPSRLHEIETAVGRRWRQWIHDHPASRFSLVRDLLERASCVRVAVNEALGSGPAIGSTSSAMDDLCDAIRRKRLDLGWYDRHIDWASERELSPVIPDDVDAVTTLLENEEKRAWERFTKKRDR